MSDPHDDELRRRLRALPGSGGPGGGLDPDAAIAGARRRRRPKVAALSAAATVAGVLVVAPFVAPSFAPGSMDAATMQEGGAAPEVAPGAEQEPATGGEDAGATEQGGIGDGAVAAPCAAPALRADTGIQARFLDDPADGVASIELEFPPAGGDLRIEGVGIAQVAADGGPLRIVAAPDAAQLATGAEERSASTGSGGGTIVLDDVPVDTAEGVGCGLDAPTAPAPLVVGEADGRPVVGVGEPWAP
ncbi:hypothetical protein OVA14_00880 [Agrococcus sp. SL85]|uniref:hypothetical protein n=1 Tax=Agrococcus sp. SL85 TaxID=2995141 RepID=UPI00226CD5F6|nr:hypothetical protein [Agrococcus sp. SL85]WAC66384.1 hypothetical protein OVA14_00880 [Agrococcus sp. SL85]